MATIRPTPQNALGEMRRLLKDLDIWAVSADVHARGREAREAVSRLAYLCDTPRIDVEIVLVGDSSSDEAERLNRWLGEAELHGTPSNGLSPERAPSPPLVYQRTCWLKAGARIVGESTPPVLVLALHGEQPPTNSDESICDRLANDRAMVVSVAETRYGWMDRLDRRLRDAALMVLPADLSLPLSDRLSSLLASVAPQVDPGLLQVRSAARAVDGLLRASNEALAQDERGLKVRRALVQQRISTVQTRPPQGAAEIMADLRARMTAMLSGFDSRLQDRIASLVGGGDGSILAEVEARANALVGLREEKQVHSVVTQVPDEYRLAIQGIFDERLRPHLLADIESTQELLRAGQEEIASSLERAGAPPLVPQCQYLGEDQLRRIVEPLTTVTIGYRGEIHRRGIFEIFMLARRYQMVFYILATLFGTGIARDAGKRDMWVTLSIALLAIGSIAMFGTIRKERAYALSRELDRARDTTRAEVRRLLSELERTWSTFLVRHVREQFQAMQLQLEIPLRESQARRAAETSDEKQRVQRQIQTLETTERRLGAIARRREDLSQRLAQFRGHVEQMVAPALSLAGRSEP